MTGEINIQIFDMMKQSDVVLITIYLVLTFYSIWSWAIVFDKIFKFKSLNIKTEKFNRLFWSGKMLEDIYKQVKNNVTYPSAVIFVAAMQEWESSNVLNIVKSNDTAKKESLKERMVLAMDIALSKSMSKLKYGMTFLLVVGTTSTFFGLFGTVWGLMHSFLSIASMQDSSLIVIAPGIAKALTATTFGLVAAIPATIFYNFYNIKINNFEDQMNNFSSEVLNILSKELDQ
ncbi:MAG TPA: MotA/TolQ/ExbB proton channel family protein [Rickettsiales bacterium]|nr:MotA/TolQ/ExbB proton channel family protein [Rickettsiales bacterium]